MANVKNSKDKANKQVLLQAYLDKKYKFRYDEIRNRIDTAPPQSNNWQPVHEQSVWADVQINHGSIGIDYLLNTISSRNMAPVHNPLKSWFERLKIAPNSDPFEKLCTYIILENPTEGEYTRLYISLKKWFIGAIKTIYDPYYVHKQSFIFQGPSGIGKTPFCMAFLPQQLQDLIKFAPCLDPNSKDAKIALCSRFIIVLDEIDDFFKTKQNRDNYKSYMTQKIVNERLPYAKSATASHRIASFLGTCNESTFLNDPTGTQRFCVFSVSLFRNRRVDAKNCIEKFDMADCWAAAYKLYKNAVNPEFTQEELEANEDANERYKYNSPEYETIINYLAPTEKYDEDGEFLTSTEICSYLNAAQNDIDFNNIKLGKAMVRLRFDRQQKKVNRVPLYGYYVRKLGTGLNTSTLQKSAWN